MSDEEIAAAAGEVEISRSRGGGRGVVTDANLRCHRARAEQVAVEGRELAHQRLVVRELVHELQAAVDLRSGGVLQTGRLCWIF